VNVKKKWLREPLTIIDLLAILPFYIDIILVDTHITFLAVIRLIKILRLFRVIKIGKYSTDAVIITRTFSRSKEGVFLLLFIIAIALIISSSLMFYVESISGQEFDSETQQWLRKDGSLSPFQSIPETFLWCIYMLTLVGSEAKPITLGGQFVSIATMFIGLLVLAFPVAIFAQNFTEVWDEFRVQQKQKSLHQLEKQTKQTKEMQMTKSQFYEFMIRLEKEQIDLADKINAIAQKQTDVTTLLGQLKKLHLVED